MSAARAAAPRPTATPPRARLAQTLAAVLAIALVALACIPVRRHLAAWLIADGAPRSQAPLREAPAPPRARLRPPAPADGPHAAARPPVRVVVLDGLSRADAHGPALDALCAAGTDLAVDVGFPTKSLPVQAVLWTGLTAQQLGLGPHNGARTLRDPLPSQVPGALAVVESWTVIARSLGFGRVWPDPIADRALDDHDPTAAASWRIDFPEQAVAAAASDAPLVLIHVLAIDEAAHAGGRRSAAYRAALAAGDALLAHVRAARPDARWLVLADHGHLRRGGHGDRERAVRIVRACLSDPAAGTGATAGAVTSAVHLIDVARLLRDWLGVAPLAGAVGRPLDRALAAPAPDATLPVAPRARLLWATLVLVLAALAGRRWARPRWALGWLPAAVLAYLVWRGVPSLSFRDPRAALGCAALFAAPLVMWSKTRPGRVIMLLLPTLTATAIAAILAGVPTAIVDGTPPAIPIWTAVLQLVATVTAAALATAAGLGGWHLAGRRYRARSATPDTSQPDG